MKAAIRTALAALMSGDPDFVAEVQALGLGSHGAAVTPGMIHGNTPFQQLGQDRYPTWVTDSDDDAAAPGAEGSDPDGMVLGAHQQTWQFEFLFSLVWHQQNVATALAQRDAMLPAVVRLLLRNPSVVGTCDLAAVVRVENDQSIKHPTHTTTFVIRAFATIHRDTP